MYRFAILLLILTVTATAADWTRFRGPDGQGVSKDTGLPAEWSSTKNIVWKAKLPGPGASSPITLGKRIYITAYTGYGLDSKEPGKQEDLRRHVLCLDRADGKTVWAKEFKPQLPEHVYNRHESDYHGYAASTPITDGKHLYVFFGKSGVYCLDLDGNEVWNSSVGKGINGWGSGASPILYKNLLIVNASIESGALVALDKTSGKEVWRTPGMSSAWNTPIITLNQAKDDELVISVNNKVLGLDPTTGKERWKADGVKSYVIPSVVAQDGVAYVTGGGSLTTALKTGGSGDVTKTHQLWKATKGSNASSPVLHEGYLYFISGNGGTLNCQDIKTGEFAYTERLKPDTGFLWASPIAADGKLYLVSQFKGTYVVAAGPKFKLLAVNTFDDDKSRSNASIAVSDGQLLFRNDAHLYCIGKK
ncbi:MAG: PQQ-binding-like beta-propeller repeat protein [Planctomycetes bacterium]|nr:PQQ-binding-like beta-propeller repeat protein [Planctomycetota bacterium]